MILASAPHLYLLLALCTALLYAVPALGAQAIGRKHARQLMTLAWILHAVLLAWTFGRKPQYFGFAQTLSVSWWLALTVYIIENRLYPQLPAQWPLALLGSFCIILSLFFPGGVLPPASSGWLALHWALGLSAYGLFAAAVEHAWLIGRAEHQVRLAKTQNPRIPLLTLERLMFRFVAAGFALLTLTLLAGLLFGEQLYGSSGMGWHWDHKHVFTVLSWLIFAILLLGRHYLGWRGKRATQMVYAGAACLLLGYAGSRFVFEIFLGRTPWL